MAQRDAENLISKLRAMGEEGLSFFMFPRLRCAPPRERLRRGAARPLRGLNSNVIEFIS
jgi:hypothetical protein